MLFTTYVCIVLQTEFSQISYQLIGDGNMPSFFSLNTASGWITVSSPLTAENQDYYIGRIRALDGGNPPRTATVTVKINIRRNLNTPVFTQAIYTTNVDEIVGVSTSLLRVTCTDSDVLVCIITSRTLKLFYVRKLNCKS